MQLALAGLPRKNALIARVYNASRHDGEHANMSTQEDESVRSQSMPPHFGRSWTAQYDPPTFDRRKPKIFDGTINIPTVMTFITMIVMVVGFGISIYTTLDKRLSSLENSDKEQEAHFARLEAQNQEFRSDTKQTLTAIDSKVGQVRDWMLQDGRVANRPEASQWTRGK